MPRRQYRLARISAVFKCILMDVRHGRCRRSRKERETYFESDLGKRRRFVGFRLGISPGVKGPGCSRHWQRRGTFLDPWRPEGGPLRWLTTGTGHSSSLLVSLGFSSAISASTVFSHRLPPLSGESESKGAEGLCVGCRGPRGPCETRRILSRTCPMLH